MLREATIALLRAQGHHAYGAMCAEEIDEAGGAELPDLYLIDINLPGEDGLKLARRLRQARPTVGIIMATARTQLNDRIAGYDHGADIYLPKPVDPAEMLAAISALTHRIRPSDDDHPLRLDAQRLQLQGPLGTVSVSATESQLLVALAQASLQTLERWQIATHLNVSHADRQRANLDVRMSQLRKKLREAGADDGCLQSIRNHGYRLCVPISVV